MSKPLTDKINALITYANEITGGSDTKLGDAVYSLGNGYGGSLEPFINTDGNFTLSEDFTSTTYTTIYNLPDPNNAYTNQIINRGCNSILISSMWTEAIDTIWYTLSTCNGYGTKQTYNTNGYINKTTGAIVYNNSAFGIQPYMAYGFLARVSGKCTSSITSMPAGIYYVNFKAFDIPSIFIPSIT